MPIIGAMIAAAVIVLPGKPIIGEIGRRPKITYRAVKHTVKAISFVESFLMSILQSLHVLVEI